MKRLKLLWYVLTDGSFGYWLAQVVKYSEKCVWKYHGEGASDVVLFIGRYGDVLDEHFVHHR